LPFFTLKYTPSGASSNALFFCGRHFTGCGVVLQCRWVQASFLL
jgi:hypothetical protein